MPIRNTDDSMRVLTVKLPDELGRELERAAGSRGISKSQLAREAISRHVALPDRRGGQFVSSLELAGDLAGSIHRSPRGLATDPKFLDRFGRS